MKETSFNQDQKKDFLDYIIKFKNAKYFHSCISFGDGDGETPVEKEEIECLIKNKKCIVLQTRHLQDIQFEIVDISLNDLIQFLSKYNIFKWGYSSEDNPCYYFYDNEKKQNIKCYDYNFDVLFSGSWDFYEYGEISKWIDEVSSKEKKLLEDYFEDELDSDYNECDDYEYSGSSEITWDPGDVSDLTIDILSTSAYDDKSKMTYDQKVIERIIFYREQ